MDEMATLAAAAAATLVTAMATDTWTGVRDTVAKLFRRRRRGRAAERIEAELDADAAAVARAAEPDAARRALLGRWTLEFAALLNDDPDCLVPLAELVVAYSSDLGENRRVFLANQTAAAHEYATVFAVQHGDMHLYGHLRTTTDRTGP
ncbi:hypothetical protein ABIA35_004552 [Catenulispora sp. MAP12-49]|uniref:hypothetical protein n=1 Tax=Catenulispora sp. MAP12-49 TaxID=3156302 RepID=UPI0035189ADE